MVATHVVATVAPDGELSFAHALAGGRASALFAVLAGVSLGLMTGRRDPVAGQERWARCAGLAVRALLIASFGLLLGELDSGLAVILTHYGLLFLLALAFVGLRAPALLILAAAWAVLAPVLSQVVRPLLPERGYDSPTLGQLADPLQLLSELTFTGYYPVVPWLGYLLLGLGIGRLDLRRRTVQLRMVCVGLGLAVLATLVSRALLGRPGVARELGRDLGLRGVDAAELQRQVEGGMFGNTPTAGSWDWLLVVAPHSTTPFDLAQTMGSALAVIGVCLLVVAALPSFAVRVVSIVFGAGTMTLTLYSLHVLLRTDLLWPPDEGAYAQHALVLLAIGAVFVGVGCRGPLERLVGAASERASALVHGP